MEITWAFMTFNIFKESKCSIIPSTNQKNITNYVQGSRIHVI